METRDRILALAEKLFREHGYQGFSYADISKPLSIKNAAVHYHFPTKEELGIALIEKYRTYLHEQTGDFMANGGDALVQLEGYFAFVEHEVRSLDHVCPIGITAMEYHNVPDAMRESARRFLEETLAWLERVLEVGRAQGTMHFEGSAADKAVALKATIQGAGQLTRITRKDLLSVTVAQVRRDLGLPESPSRT